MRQRNALIAVLGVSAVLVAVLVVFACERSVSQQEPTAPARGTRTQEPAAKQAAEPHGEHAHEVAAHHAGAEEGAGQAAEPAAHHGHEHPPAAPAGEAPQPGVSGEFVEGVRVVEVVARQFEFEPSTITVKQGEKVRLKVTSKDVTHGIGIEGYDIDQVLESDTPVVIEFTADKPGRHHFHCSVYCGKGHNDMHGELVVLEQSK